MPDELAPEDVLVDPELLPLPVPVPLPVVVTASLSAQPAAAPMPKTIVKPKPTKTCLCMTQFCRYVWGFDKMHFFIDQQFFSFDD